MKTIIKKITDLKNIKTSVLVSCMTEEYFKNNACNCKKKCNCVLKRAEKNQGFKGKEGQICNVIEPNVNKKYDYVIFVGLGKEKNVNLVSVQKLGETLVSYLNSNKLKNATLVVNSQLCCDNKVVCVKKVGSCELDEIVANIAFGMEMKAYTFNKYYTGEKLKAKKPKFVELTISGKNSVKLKEYKTELDLIKENVFFCRDLVSEPANELTTESYAAKCKELEKLGLKVEIYGEKKLKEMGAHSLLAVGQGSDYESKMIIFKWNGAKNKKEKPISFIGKGVVFDSGGISIKPSNGMGDMKGDMGGSAVVFSLMRLLAMRKANVNVIGAIGIVENMPSSKAQRPGDVVKSMSGQTIEVINTDAEGRMVLADVLYYIEKTFKPKIMIDLATLTGAVVVALGEDNAGLFSLNDSLIKELEVAAKQTGENAWRMPLSELGGAYDKLVDSDIADVRNTAAAKYSGGGSITAAQFLQRFTNKHKKWCHIDIAGVADVSRPNFFVNKGATGYGVRLLDSLVKNNYEF